MILIVIAALCVLTVPLAGGRLMRLGDLRVRAIWLAPFALGLQLLITTVLPEGNRSLHVAIHIATYGLVAVFLLANRRLPGVAVIATGAIMNAFAIVINGGVMPAAASAQRIAGLALGTGFGNSARLAHPHLLWLGDVIPVPGPLPNVISSGDLIVFAGMILLLHGTCGRAAVRRGPAQRLPGVQI